MFFSTTEVRVLQVFGEQITRQISAQLENHVSPLEHYVLGTWQTLGTSLTTCTLEDADRSQIKSV